MHFKLTSSIHSLDQFMCSICNYLSRATTVGGRARAMWWMRLHSAFRTALACAVVGCTTLFGPAYFTHQTTFPAFSYVTIILIHSDATLGETIRGCWHAMCATLQVLPLTVGILRIAGPERFSPAIAALAVALTSFLVALPSTHLTSKRIAFGQIVIVFVDAVINGKNRPGELMHPVHVAASTALGAISAFLALLLPFPRPAYSEVKKLCRLYAENASERINLYLNASISGNQQTAMDLISRAKPLAARGQQLLDTITLLQEGILWEMPWMRFSKRHFTYPGDTFQGMETLMRGMELAINSSPRFPAESATEELADMILSFLPQLHLKLSHARCLLPLTSTTVPEPKGESTDSLIPLNYKLILSEGSSLSAVFFLSCAEQFLKAPNKQHKPEPILETHPPEREQLREPQERPTGLKEMWRKWISKLKNERLLFATKCSLSLGLAVLIGLTFHRGNGYWSGLTVAISLAEGRQAIVTVANARAQGTAIGSVYGVFVCFIFKKFAGIRFIALLPWIIFTRFLRYSRMYGDPGGISADIAALLILGRHKYGPTNDFAITRLSEAVVGLTTFVFVELLLEPITASTLAKRHLYLCLGIFQECMARVVQFSRDNGQSRTNLQAFNEEHLNLKSQVQKFKILIEQAELEPSLWFSPFRGSCYQKLQESLVNMADLLHCMSYSLEFVLQAPENQFSPRKELQEQIEEAFKFCNDALGSSLRCLEKENIVKSYGVHRQQQEVNRFHDLENGNFQTSNAPTVLHIEDKQIERIGSLFLQQFKTDTNGLRNEDDSGLGRICALPALGFCTSYFIRGIQEAQIIIRELIHWETT